MKYQIVMDSKPDHCLHCPLRDDGGDGCVMQRDEHGYFIEFEDWEAQMANCPIKAVSDDNR